MLRNAPNKSVDNDPLSLNRYVYCGLDPVNFVDPTGFKSNWINDNLSQIGEFAAGAALELIGFTCDLGTATLILGAVPTGGGSLAVTTVTISGSALAKTTGAAMMAHAASRMSFDPNKPIGDQLSGTLKRSKSYSGELANKTPNELAKIAKQGGELGRKASKMLKLVKESERLMDKVKGK